MSLNQTIIQSPVILFLGAGASVPLGKPTMEQFVLKLESEIVPEDQRSLFSLLISARGRDLERILGDLETILSLDYVSSFVCERDTLSYQATGEDAANLLSLIRHAIIREYRKIEANRAIEVYEPLFDIIFDYLDPANYCLPVFTTNYDLAIESFSEAQQYPKKYELTDGLRDDSSEREVCWDPLEFELFRIWRGMRHIVLFKLHGSVNWMRTTSSNKIVQALPMYDIVDSDEYQNVISYPAGNKVATVEPYLTGYKYFSKCCEQAKLIIAVGYSFRDYDTVASLLRAREINDNLRLLLVSPNSYHVLESIPDENRMFWTHGVYAYFGDPSGQTEYLARIKEWLVLQIKK
jgi:hypothetical protein